LFISVAESTEIFGPLRRNCREVFGPRSKERPARGREQDARDAIGLGARSAAGGQALEDRVVLAVDREYRGARVSGRPEQQAAGEHERFLVGEQELLARGGRRERRREADGADEGRHDRIRLGVRRDVDERIRARGHARRQSRGGDALREPRRRGAVRERRHDGPVTLHLRE
jgi:hypothetical protein